MAEPYPEMLRLIFRFQKWKWQNLFLRNPFFADIVEKLTLRYIDHVIVVVEESKDRLVQFGVPQDKITVITNATVFGNENGLELPELYAESPGSLKMVYLGLLGESRGLQTVIEAMPDIVRNCPDIRLYILGSGSAATLLKSMVKEKELENNVLFLGWVDNECAKKYIKHADIALLPHFSCGHWDNTIPNKLFDYMAYGIPIVASDVPPMKRIVEEEGCGLIFNSGDYMDFARVVTTLMDKTLRQQLGVNGKLAVKEKYHWQHSEAQLVETLEKECGHGRSIN
jgi:glycosyltransferase involved in cell wall biosynthesis